MDSKVASKPTLKDRLQGLIVEFGAYALVVYFVIFALVVAGFAAAISLGFNDGGAYGTLGILGAAYVAAQVTKPLRILATVAVTPAVMALFKKKRNSGATSSEIVPEQAPETTSQS